MIKRIISIGILVAFYIVLPIISIKASYKPISVINEDISISAKNENTVESVIPEIIEVDIYTQKCEELLHKQEELNVENLNNKDWFITYKNLIDEYSEWCDPPETIYDYYSEDEIYLMQRCIETEAFECDFDSKCNVASVILNRIANEEYSNAVNEVVVPGQFAFGRKIISEDTILALEYVFMIEDTTNGALYFHSNDKIKKFNDAAYMFTDDVGHHFYK